MDVLKERLTFCEAEAFTAMVPKRLSLLEFLCLADLDIDTDVSRFESPKTISSNHDYSVVQLLANIQ